MKTISISILIIIVLWLLHVIYVKVTKNEIHYDFQIWFNVYLVINITVYSTYIEIINLNE